jgi:dolichol kinase
MSVDPDRDERRARQRSRSILMAIGLVIFAILMFAITIARMGAQTS